VAVFLKINDIFEGHTCVVFGGAGIFKNKNNSIFARAHKLTYYSQNRIVLPNNQLPCPGCHWIVASWNLFHCVPVFFVFVLSHLSEDIALCLLLRLSRCELLWSIRHVTLSWKIFLFKYQILASLNSAQVSIFFAYNLALTFKFQQIRPVST
jgi:hypothetical protein